MKTLSLYNNDGTLSTLTKSMLSPKPVDVSMKDWRMSLKEFRKKLSPEDLKEFNRLKRNASSALTCSKWQAKYPEKVKQNNAKWAANNPEKVKNYSKWYYSVNSEERKKYNSKWYSNNPEKIALYRSTYYNKIKDDPQKRIFVSMRKACNRVVKQVGLGKKPTNTFKWVGCSPEQLKAHIESLFQEGMTWDNYGKHGWHVDHIRPVSSFKPEEWEQINHYTNLQPLWWRDNLSKSNNYQH